MAFVSAQRRRAVQRRQVLDPTDAGVPRVNDANRQLAPMTLPACSTAIGQAQATVHAGSQGTRGRGATATRFAAPAPNALALRAGQPCRRDRFPRHQPAHAAPCGQARRDRGEVSVARCPWVPDRDALQTQGAISVVQRARHQRYCGGSVVPAFSGGGAPGPDEPANSRRPSGSVTSRPFARREPSRA